MSEPPSTDPLGKYLPPDTPEQAKVDQRNWFYESLSVEAKSRFLDALKDAQTRGLGMDAAWEEAVVAAETTYPPDDVEEASTVAGTRAGTRPALVADEEGRLPSHDPADKVDNL